MFYDENLNFTFVTGERKLDFKSCFSILNMSIEVGTWTTV